jgi:hypothetical protein
MVATAAAEAAAATATAGLLTEAATRVRAMQEAIVARIAGGGAQIGDSLALDSRAQSLELQISEQHRRFADAEAEVRGRLGLAEGQPIPAASYPDLARIDPERVPMARRARAMHSDARAMEREATARANPETGLDLRWEREAAGTPEQADTYSLALTVSLPVWRQAYADTADSARASARAAGHEAQASAWMARSQLSRAARATTIATQARATAEAVAERTRSEYDAMTRQVGTGAASLGMALELLDRISEARMQAIEAEFASRMALAGLWRLAPPELADTPATDDHEHGSDARTTSGKVQP